MSSLDLIERNELGGEIWQGDAASACEANGRFSVIAFCADDFQPKRELLTKLSEKTHFVYAPMDDAQISKKELNTAMRAADLVKRHFQSGRKVLVTCLQGRNRSGLVVALALHMIYGMGGGRAALQVRTKRHCASGPALSNPSFNKLLEKIPPKRVDVFHGMALGGVR